MVNALLNSFSCLNSCLHLLHPTRKPLAKHMIGTSFLRKLRILKENTSSLIHRYIFSATYAHEYDKYFGSRETAYARTVYQ